MIESILSRVFSFFKEKNQNHLYKAYRKRYSIDPSFVFNGEGILMYGDGDIHIKENSYVGRNSIIQSSKGNNIEIGKNCKIGPFLAMWTDSVHIDADFNRPDTIVNKAGNIFIGDGVWIGVGVYISPGVNIGSNSVIGANSVVVKDVPEYAVVGGVPARVLRYKVLSNEN